MAYNTILPMRRDFKKGDIIFHQGDKGDCAYIIEKGSIEVFLNDDGIESSVSQLGVGEIFGEMAIIDSNPRSASVRASEDCLLSLISKEQLNSRISEADSIVKLLMHILLKRIRLETYKRCRGKKKVEPKPSPTQAKQDAEDQMAIARIQFEKELENALTNDQLSIHYQPIFEMSSGQLAGFEALIRWKHPSKGWVKPDLFMAIAEESPLIISIGQWVLKRSIEDLAKINKYLKVCPFMSINVSGRQIKDPLFFRILQNCVQNSECDITQIKLEITERVLVDKKTIMKWIHTCQEIGLTVAIDDFGTGYSGLSSLAQLNIDNFKIDKSFIEKLGQCKNNDVVVKGLIDMAHNLNISVVAEGVETEEQKEILKGMGCRYNQGYIYSKPLPIDVLIRFISHLELQRVTA